jgi:hypothetical protein
MLLSRAPRRSSMENKQCLKARRTVLALITLFNNPEHKLGQMHSGGCKPKKTAEKDEDVA